MKKLNKKFLIISIALSLSSHFNSQNAPLNISNELQMILDNELPFISIESWGCVHEDGQEFEQII